MSGITPTHASALTQLGHALSDGTRTGILLALREGPARPSDLAERLGVSRQSMSNQLACLRGCGLVVGEAQGRSTWYRLSEPRLGSALGGLLELVVRVDPTCCSPEGCSCR
jgi:ArsR family transcriptional regulator, cadmium/lead-responsive transcriptional repressor